MHYVGASFIYYGVVLMTTELFETPGSHGVCTPDGGLKVQCSAQCRQLDRLDYTHLLWTTLAEFPGIMLTVLLVDKIGRRKTMMAELLLLCISLCFLFKCSLDRVFITIILFFIRGLASGVFQAAYVYTAEVKCHKTKVTTTFSPGVPAQRLSVYNVTLVCQHIIWNLD